MIILNYSISPASSNPFLATITAINSLIMAAAAIVPCTICTSCGSEDRVEQIIPKIRPNEEAVLTLDIFLLYLAYG